LKYIETIIKRDVNKKFKPLVKAEAKKQGTINKAPSKKDESFAPVKKEEKQIETKAEEQKVETKVKEVKKIKKTEAFANVKSLPISTKKSIAVCKFIKGKTIAQAISDLESRPVS